MKEQMERLQQQLEASQKVSVPSASSAKTSGKNSPSVTPVRPKTAPTQQPASKLSQARPATNTQKTPAGKENSDANSLCSAQAHCTVSNLLSVRLQ